MEAHRGQYHAFFNNITSWLTMAVFNYLFYKTSNKFCIMCYTCNINKTVHIGIISRKFFIYTRSEDLLLSCSAARLRKYVIKIDTAREVSSDYVIEV